MNELPGEETEGTHTLLSYFNTKHFHELLPVTMVQPVLGPTKALFFPFAAAFRPELSEFKF